MTCMQIAKRIFIGLTFLCVLLFAVAGFAAQPYEGIAKIYHGNAEQWDWTGTGSMVRLYHNDEYCVIISVRHVGSEVGDEVELEWKSAGGQRTKGIVATVLPKSSRDGNYTHEQNVYQTDLCIILAKAPKGVKPLEYEKFDPSKGPFVSVGYRGKNMWVTIATQATDHKGLILTNTDFVGGMSGGPTLNKHGKIVAIVSASDDANNVGISVDGENLKKILEQYQ